MKFLKEGIIPNIANIKLKEQGIDIDEIITNIESGELSRKILEVDTENEHIVINIVE